MALSESFFEPLVASDQKASLVRFPLLLHPFMHLPGVLLCSLAHQTLKGAPCVGSYSSSGHQAFGGPASLLFSCDTGLWGKSGCGDGSTPYA